jgi:hypothetical protein
MDTDERKAGIKFVAQQTVKFPSIAESPPRFENLFSSVSSVVKPLNRIVPA